MKYLFCLLISFALMVTSNAQTKYFIYFKDKGISPSVKLQKTSSYYKLAEAELSPRAIERRKAVMGDNYIIYEDIPLNESYLDQLTSLGVKIENQLRWFNAVTSYLTDSQVEKIITLPFVQKVEPVKFLKENREEQNYPFVPQPPIEEKQTSYMLNYGPSLTENALSDIPTVHDLGIKGTNVYIGILDDGFDYKVYPALKNLKVLRQHDYVHNLDTVSNQSGHGSSVFCLMAGYDPGNAIGPAYNAKFFLAETENDASETHVEEDNYAAALQDMESAGVDITSSSLGYSIFDQGQTSYTYQDMNGNTTIVAKAINIAYQLGVACFTAAGNEGSYWGAGNGGLVSPGDAFNVITIGAVASNNQVASFSSRGPTYDGRIKPEVVAMGSGNYVASFGGNGYQYGNGTSYATPIAAGIGALLKSAWPHLTNFQIRKTFLECGDNTYTPNNDRGWGLISAARAIAYPNLQQVSGAFRLNKIFVDANGVNSSTVKLYYKVNGSNYKSVSMNYDNSLKYNYDFPTGTNGDQLEFYFTYNNGGGTSIREPSGTNTYKFSYGSLNVSDLTSVSSDNSSIPSDLQLMQNYPNPFNPSTVISYHLPAGEFVTLKIYDLLGKEVATLVNEFELAGTYNSQFSIRNLPAGRQGSQLSSGVYFYMLRAGDFVQTKKMILMK